MLNRRSLLGAALWPLAAAAAAPLTEFQVAGSRLELQFDDSFGDALRHDAQTWAETSARAVAGYFGRFPLPAVELVLQAVDGAGVRQGVTYAEPQPFVRLRLGRDTTPAQFRDDWVLVHEMVHLAIPRVARAHNWLHEGIATYVEGIARTQAGLVPVRRLWIELAAALPQGQPREGDRGLDNTPTWARTYWGGAMFCLLADVRLRERSGNRAGLQHALQGVLAAGGSYAVAWPVTRILATADAAVGQTTLTDLYEQMKDSPVSIDLPALWRELGIAGTRLLDDAPQAAVRRAIATARNE